MKRNHIDKIPEVGPNFILQIQHLSHKFPPWIRTWFAKESLKRGRLSRRHLRHPRPCGGRLSQKSIFPSTALSVFPNILPSVVRINEVTDQSARASPSLSPYPSSAAFATPAVVLHLRAAPCLGGSCILVPPVLPRHFSRAASLVSSSFALGRSRPGFHFRYKARKLCPFAAFPLLSRFTLPFLMLSTFRISFG